MIRIEDIDEDSIVFYDIETTGVYAPYCELKMIGYQVGLNGEPELVDPNSEKSKTKFRNLVNRSDMLKVGFNNINFDDIVLWRYGFYVNPKYRHDLYLALKTVHPTFPSYGLKFVNWWIDADQTPMEAMHWWEHDLHGWLRRNYREAIYQAPVKKLGKYCLHDVSETVNVFCAIWEKVQIPQHWRPYTTLELAMGEPLHEMMLLGRELINLDTVQAKIVELEGERKIWDERVYRWTDGRIKNIASNQQATKFMHDVLKMEFAISDAGNFLWRKSDKLQFLDDEENKLTFREIARARGDTGGRLGTFDYGVLEGMEDNALYNIKLIEEYKLETKLTIASYEVHDILKVIGYLRSYLHAGRYEKRWQGIISNNGRREDIGFHPINTPIGSESGRNGNRRNDLQRNNGSNPLVWIPKSYGLSAAKTRRFRSSSRFSYKDDNGEEIKFGINWQNQNKRSKTVQIVPRGWLGFWLDSTQIENVVHIWASDDDKRREAYENDPYWNEYVWLSNMILGKDLDKAKLEQMTSSVNSAWSVYKQYKTIKLALNFGMGPEKFARITGLNIKDAVVEFNKVHKACPAIKRLQNIVRERIKEEKFVDDPFGHIYSGEADEAYKIVAYLVQGCGTGSVPKAMTVANYKTLHQYDTREPLYYPYIRHPHTGRYSYGVLCGTTHDECAGRISLGLWNERIIDIVKNLLYNMEGRFSKLFDGIPLRAKLAVSISNAAEQKELDHRESNFEELLVTYIEKGRKRYEKKE